MIVAERGCVFLVGEAVEDVVHYGASSHHPEIQRYCSRRRRDDSRHHITLITKHECRCLQQRQQLQHLQDSLREMMKPGESSEPLSLRFVDLGVGRTSSPTDRTSRATYHVIAWPGGDVLRAEVGLPPKDFHITLSDVDVHDAGKGHDTLVCPRDDIPPADVEFLCDAFLSSKAVATSRYPLLRYMYAHIHPTEKLFYFLTGTPGNGGGGGSSSDSDAGFVLDEMDAHPGWVAPYLRLADHLSPKEAMICMLEARRRVVCCATDERKNGANLVRRIDALLMRCAESTLWGHVFLRQEAERMAHTFMLCADGRGHEQRMHVRAARVVRDALQRATTTTTRGGGGGDNDNNDNRVVIDAATASSRSSSPWVMRPCDPREQVLCFCGGATPGHIRSLPRFFSWVVPFVLCAMSTPRSLDDVRALAGRPLGVRLVVTLTEEIPLDPSWFGGGADDEEEEDARCVRNLFLPVPNRRAPTRAQADAFIDAVHACRGPACVHCGGGKGRAGTMLACYLAACGFSTQRQEVPAFDAAQAVALVQHLRPGSVESSEQEAFVREFVSGIWKREGDDRDRAREKAQEEIDQERERRCLPLVLSVRPAGSLLFGRKGPPSVVLCCGLPGSGKSSFAARLAAGSRCPYTVLSQDELGGKAPFFGAVHDAFFARKERVVLDRCHVDARSRREVMDALFRPNDVLCVCFELPVDACIRRASARVDHPSLRQGRAATAVRCMAKAFEPVVDAHREGFATVATVRSDCAAEELLAALGCAGAQQQRQQQEQEQATTPRILKFPRTRHLLNLGTATRDDLVMSPDEARAFLLAPGPEPVRICLQEKLDGANLGFSIDPDTLRLRAQNRSHYVSAASQTQFRALDAWMNDHQDDLWTVLTRDGQWRPGRAVLYGEWLAARHSIHYTRLSDVFIAFDLYDVEARRFCVARELREALKDTSITMIDTRELECGRVTTRELEHLVTTQRSAFYDGPLEGVYVRRETGYSVEGRAKVVRPGFISGDGSTKHWGKTSRKMVWNGVSVSVHVDPIRR